VASAAHPHPPLACCWAVVPMQMKQITPKFCREGFPKSILLLSYFYYICKCHIFRCHGVIILETYTTSKSNDLVLPDFLQIIKEVTDDPYYSMYNLSKRSPPLALPEVVIPHTALNGVFLHPVQAQNVSQNGRVVNGGVITHSVLPNGVVEVVGAARHGGLNGLISALEAVPRTSEAVPRNSQNWMTGARCYSV